MKVLFKEIRAGDLEAVRIRLDARPDLVGATATAPPKKDDGQSPLQVATKTGHFEIAHLLLDRGADVNFMETSEVNEWTTPVLHDGVRAATMCSRWPRPQRVGDQKTGWVPSNTTERADAAFGLLERMVLLGASVTAKDSYGNCVLERAIMDARQLLPHWNSPKPDTAAANPLNPEFEADLRRIFALIISNGADPTVEVDRHSKRPLLEFYRDEPVGPFLNWPYTPNEEPVSGQDPTPNRAPSPDQESTSAQPKRPWQRLFPRRRSD